MNIQTLKIVSFFILSTIVSYAQTVPDRIEFAGMQLHLTKSARARVQADVDMIKKSPTYFQQKVDRANLYFPVIDKVFAEENFPSEFKYLALQESSLVSDAVSSSKAVGYWQFKKESAVEVGVRVDNMVDERMNIYASSRGASKYLKRNQGALNNWVYTLLSYNLGLGGVQSHVKAKYVGAQSMEIDEDMHWYVFRFLAHKIAYETAVGQALHSQLHLVGYKESGKKSLKDIAKETGIEEEVLVDYNKWCLRKEVPGNGDYVVVLPVPVAEKDQYIAKYGNAGQEVTVTTTTTVVKSETPISYTPIDDSNDWEKAPMWVSINRVNAVKASGDKSIDQLVALAGITKEGFLRFNEMTAGESLKAGQYYYLQVKRTKAIVAFHTVQPGESLWSISQRYGVKSNAIRSKNRMNKNEQLKEGRVLWMRDKRPKSHAVEYKKVEVTPVVSIATPVVIKDSSSKEEVVKKVVRNEEQYIYHTVLTGETMFSISRKYDVSSDSILVWNNMTSYGLKTGQDLIVGLNTKKITHVVGQGETLYKISKQYNVPMDTILKNNNKVDPALKMGEVLIIQ